MPRIMVIDTLYPDFIRTLPFDPSSTYEVELQKVLDRKFGTADFYSRNLKALGWDAVDVIANHAGLNELWMREHGKQSQPTCGQIGWYDPDVVFLQDLNVDFYRANLMAAQVSCPWPGDEQIKRCDVVFTSFPHYVKRIEALGVRAIYNPLAFEPSVLDKFAMPGDDWGEYRLVPQLGRIHDCTFVGGVGAPSHWKYGMEVLNAVAEAIPTFRWWGYGAELLPDGPLKQKYMGQAFGIDMYKILLQSKICLNRHGEVAEGFANNMRMYEATGCGALLVTDNQTDLFAGDEIARYQTPHHAAETIRFYLDAGSIRDEIAAKGQRRTLKDHTYAKRMKVVSDTLQEMLCPA